jgi:uncharacterized RDD family membrane protein YckC
MRGFDLPSTQRADAAWEDVAPDTTSRPDLYDGLLIRRSLAFLVDWVLLGIVYFVFYILALFLGVFTLGMATPLIVMVVPLIPALYVTATLGDAACATPGMRLMDVQMRGFDGSQPGYARAFLLAVFFYITCSLTSGLVLIVGFFSDRRRLLHDMLTGLVAVRASRIEAAHTR